MDCSFDVNVKLDHGSFPEVWVDVCLKQNKKTGSKQSSKLNKTGNIQKR